MLISVEFLRYRLSADLSFYPAPIAKPYICFLIDIIFPLPPHISGMLVLFVYAHIYSLIVHPAR